MRLKRELFWIRGIVSPLREWESSSCETEEGRWKMSGERGGRLGLFRCKCECLVARGTGRNLLPLLLEGPQTPCCTICVRGAFLVILNIKRRVCVIYTLLIHPVSLCAKIVWLKTHKSAPTDNSHLKKTRVEKVLKWSIYLIFFSFVVKHALV